MKNNFKPDKGSKKQIKLSKKDGFFSIKFIVREIKEQFSNVSTTSCPVPFSGTLKISFGRNVVFCGIYHVLCAAWLRLGLIDENIPLALLIGRLVLTKYGTRQEEVST